MFESIKLSDISKQQCGVLRGNSSTRPILRVTEENGIRAVVKDFSLNGFLFRNTIGRFLIWRESKAYMRLGGIKGIPAFYRKIGGLALVIEKIEGRDIESAEKESGLSEAFILELRALVDKFHKRGLAHCDLKRMPNIISGDDGKPYIVDWSASISEREFGLFPLNLIYQRFVHDDLNAIIKIRLKYHPEHVSPEEKIQYTHRSQAEKLIRTIRNKIRNFLQKIA
ncbi:hypothetical protein ACFL0H_01145 [Thermodesulfobacteriota bacterium]